MHVIQRLGLKVAIIDRIKILETNSRPHPDLRVAEVLTVEISRVFSNPESFDAVASFKYVAEPAWLAIAVIPSLGGLRWILELRRGLAAATRRNFCLVSKF